ncbi:MAG: ABC transporter ATP-binding protein [Christensenellaceae bacterium]|nr:ABC transporter ATP-binding protein [Christensenellaceae bacterium]
MSKIRTIDLTKRFGNFTANDRISLSVEAEEIKCIVGENGAGKSTLMNMLYGALQPTSGSILIDEREVRFKSPEDAMRAGLGMVHQHFKLVPSLTVYENILLGAEVLRSFRGRKLPFIDRAQEIERARQLIERYQFQLDPTEKVENLSVGLRQQIEILKMLYRNVDILILDEPTAVLTPQETDRLMQNLKRLRADHKTIIVITHKLREVMQLSDSTTVIKQGRVVGSVKTSETSEQALAQMMVGRDVMLTVKNEGGAKPACEPRYEVKDIETVNDDGKSVVCGVSFQVNAGEILGIAGVEGNGQSELVKVLTGVMKATDGSVRLCGEDVTNAWPDRLREKGIGIIPEDRYGQGLCRAMTLSQNCAAGYTKKVSRFGLLRARAMNRQRNAYIDKYDIRVGDRGGDVSQMSGGNAQKVIIAREFENGPKLIIACQPTRGVDIGSIEFIHSRLLEYRDAGNSVLLISSELSEIMSLSDRVIVMYKGSVIGSIDPKTASTEEIGLLMAGTKPREGGQSA